MRYDVQTALLLGGLLAALVVLLFFRDLRNTWLPSQGCRWWCGHLRCATRPGDLAQHDLHDGPPMSIGMLIDDAIVVRENIFRHMERGGAQSSGRRGRRR